MELKKSKKKKGSHFFFSKFLGNKEDHFTLQFFGASHNTLHKIRIPSVRWVSTYCSCFGGERKPGKFGTQMSFLSGVRQRSVAKKHMFGLKHGFFDKML